MNDLILTTKGSNSGARFFACGLYFIIFGIGFIIFESITGTMKEFDTKDIMSWLSIMLPLIFISMGVYMFYMGALLGKTYLEVYPGGMCGKGFQGSFSRGGQVLDFSFQNGNIVSVTTNKQMIIINTTAGQYQVAANRKKAQEVFSYYSRLPR